MALSVGKSKKLRMVTTWATSHADILSKPKVLPKRYLARDKPNKLKMPLMGHLIILSYKQAKGATKRHSTRHKPSKPKVSLIRHLTILSYKQARCATKRHPTRHKPILSYK